MLLKEDNAPLQPHSHRSPLFLITIFIMASQHARRISSLFSIRSNSSEKSLENSKSPSTLAPPTLSDEPSAIIFSEPVPMTLETPTSPNAQPSSLVPSLQTPPDDPPDDPSEAPPFPPNKPLSPVPQMILPLPENPGPQTGNRLRSGSESRLEIMADTMDKSEAERQVENRGGSRPGSGVEDRSGSRQHSPTTLQQPATSSERGLSRRRSWLPTRSKPAPQGEVDGPGPWLIRPNEKLPYDAAPLIHFQKVSTSGSYRLLVRGF